MIALGKKYPNFIELITCDSVAKKYFNSLPDYIRQQIFSQSSGVDSFESLMDCVENMLKREN